MPVEIERKFLVKDLRWRDSIKSACDYQQGYLPKQTGPTIRVRTAGDVGYLTIKGPRIGLSRAEYEYEIPLNEAKELLSLYCQKPVIEKTRYLVDYEGYTWEVDEFRGTNEGLMLAEIELASEDETPPLPEWIGKDVSTDFRYTNLQLALHPYTSWGSNEAPA